MMLHRRAADYVPPFRVLDFKVLVGQRGDVLGHDSAYAEATVKVAIGDEIAHTAAEGDGPVQALDAALRKALRPSFPGIDAVHLSDYKVRILDGRAATAAITRVLIDSTDGSAEWSTIGASSNIIEASCRALVDSIEYGLLQAADRPSAKVAS